MNPTLASYRTDHFRIRQGRAVALRLYHIADAQTVEGLREWLLWRAQKLGYREPRVFVSRRIL